ncbi:5'/3'-nucleotidase SurE [Acidobacteria bacterium ACD]|nr:MAG: 5'/3'-nucleotidase SurE [Acidobacteriota bacterium]MCE7960734.1 5'/3'-nucleotidase SurE [Acidobacteria bacterium ACB2]MDL1950372.1 5'/3'-nucleotidase SurE [Acidobacteria bacterium ACD]
MRALISNDDGIFAPGLAALERAAAEAGFETYVVAPDREQSASSHSLTMHRPLRISPAGERRFTVDGTPTDCVNLALKSILAKTPPDFVFSGINAGPNLGDDVTYSGTVAAAFEGTLLGVRSIAFSLDYRRDDSGAVPDFTEAERIAGRVMRIAMEHPLPAETLWNVNVPPGNPKGIRPTRLGKRRYEDSVVQKLDPRGRPYYWIGGYHIDTPADGTDLEAVADGWVSLTPLHLDMTDHRALQRLEEIRERLERG